MVCKEVSEGEKQAREQRRKPVCHIVVNIMICEAFPKRQIRIYFNCLFFVLFFYTTLLSCKDFCSFLRVNRRRVFGLGSSSQFLVQAGPGKVVKTFEQAAPN